MLVVINKSITFAFLRVVGLVMFALVAVFKIS